MRRYRFSLESALRARRAQEDVARQRLAGANHRLVQSKALAAAALDAYRAMALQRDAVERVAFVAARDHEMRMAGAVARAQRTVAERQVEATTCYAAWVEAGKQVASLERLDERRRAEWQVEVQREEAAAVDDVVGARWAVTGSRAEGLL